MKLNHHTKLVKCVVGFGLNWTKLVFCDQVFRSIRKKITKVSLMPLPRQTDFCIRRRTLPRYDWSDRPILDEFFIESTARPMVHCRGRTLPRYDWYDRPILDESSYSHTNESHDQLVRPISAGGDGPSPWYDWSGLSISKSDRFLLVGTDPPPV